ncbi:class I SAM-dependent methyltransferase [Plantactinospora endophytica]|uniref:Methyltransferase n=1 Tax=Plantactinospora endophytica TaxID=673535 RepID=A0ABQ4DUW9_9ACTN|nr:class I SAM-dependent methyltransferase [Plantactinospora endophytica]GIG86259.1 methyltransferase [Plantactinospora endophytica]
MEGYTSATYGDGIADIYDEPGQCPPDAEYAASFLDELGRGRPEGRPRILEFGIGTGRIALPLADRGCDVTGVDSSAAMLEKCRVADDQGRLRLVHDTMETVDAGHSSFDIVFAAYNTLFLALSQEEQIEVFANARRHLVPGGRFVVQALVPDPASFTGNQRIRVYDLDKDLVDLDVTLHDPVRQTLVNQYLILRPACTEFRPSKLRYAWPSELDLMARLAGLRLEQRYGTWQRSPFTADSTDHVSVYRIPAGD